MNHDGKTNRGGVTVWLRAAARAGAAALGLSWAGLALAQPPGVGGPGPTRPTTSPYLNLLQGGNRGNAALNYYRLVRPEQEWRRYDAQLNQQVTGLRRDVNNLQAGLLPDGSRPLSTSGHATSFQNLGSYFPGSQGGPRTGIRR